MSPARGSVTAPFSGSEIEEDYSCHHRTTADHPATRLPAALRPAPRGSGRYSQTAAIPLRRRLAAWAPEDWQSVVAVQEATWLPPSATLVQLPPDPAYPEHPSGSPPPAQREARPGHHSHVRAKRCLRWLPPSGGSHRLNETSQRPARLP